MVIYFVFGMMARNISNIEGRGIFPDVEIKSSLSDRINKVDPELNWVLEDIKGKH